MTSFEAASLCRSRPRRRASAISSVLAAGAIVPILLAASVLPLLTPPASHALLEAAGSATLAGLSSAEAQSLSDRSVAELVTGQGAFDFAGPDGSPVYDAQERAHLGDARRLLLALVGASGIAAAVLLLALRLGDRAARAHVWSAVSTGAAILSTAIVLLGALSFVAFEPLFTLFHQVAFPGGGWAFDPTSQRLVQLYPLAFWRLAATAVGVLAVGLGLLTWWLARHASRRA